MADHLGASTPLSEVRDWLFERADEGVACPACTQFTKVYKRTLTSHTARIMIAMHRCHENGEEWVYLPGLGLGHADEAKARYWGLIEGRPDELRADGSSRTGWWRLTPAGRQFVLRMLRVPKYARIFDGDVLNLMAGETVDIDDVLGTRFNYDDLMRGA
jgi:hypothetical protein